MEGSSVNLLIATGNIGKDAEQRFTQGGDSIVTFSLPIKSGFGDKAKTAWVRCSMFGKRGEAVLPYLLKGSLVGVSGEFGMNEWTNKEGQKVSTPECRVSELTLLGKPKSQDDGYSQPAPRPAAKPSQKPTESDPFSDMADDCPF